VSRLHYYCYRCYRVVGESEGRCPHCGGWIEAPSGAEYADLLLWALRHPVADVAMTAARILGARREERAVGPLRALARQSDDPYLAAQAVRSLVAIEGLGPARDFLLEIAESGRLVPAAAAAEALSRAER
jgi:hypothetical protein